MWTRAAIVLALTAAPASAFEIGLPVACDLGVDCFLQNYVDRDEGPRMRDYACGAQTYDGHDGTDIRLRSTADVAKGVPVLAVAPGVVIGIRDGVPDRLVRTEEDRVAVGVQECGNGVRIDHGDGWQTQVCHMRQGSVVAKTGDRVETGTKLGEVGYSGAAAFPHVHLSVDKDGETVDPFIAERDAACGASGPRLWSPAVLDGLAYREGVVLALGLVDGPVTLEALEEGAAPAAPASDTPAVAYVWAINLLKGDRLEVALRKDGETVAENAVTLERNKAQYLLFAGKKAPEGGWPKGSYTAEMTVTRDGRAAIDETSAAVEF